MSAMSWPVFLLLRCVLLGVACVLAQNQNHNIHQGEEECDAVLSSPEPFPRDVEWRLPFGCDFSGYFVEVALGFIPALADTPHFSKQNRLWLLKGACPESFLEKLTLKERRVLAEHMIEDDDRASERTSKSIAIEHGDPCRIRRFPARLTPHALVLRVMSEGRHSKNYVDCMRRSGADEFWLPSEWDAGVLASQGIPAEKIFTVPEIVPDKFFVPRRLSSGTNGPFTFVSVHKWEYRKGWDVLLKAYWEEFGKDGGGVLLRLKTYVPHWEIVPGKPSTPQEYIEQYAKSEFGRSLEELAPVEVVEEEISRSELRDAFYATADAFVLASRGEGWGLPQVEAMLMELPVIATNFSGPTAYLHANHSFPLRYVDVDVETGYANPDKDHLRYLLRKVISMSPEARKRVGKNARSFVKKNFGQKAVTNIIMQRLRALHERKKL